MIIEPTGNFSVDKQADRPVDTDPEVVMDVLGYRRLVEHFDKGKEAKDLKTGGGKGNAVDTANKLAAQAA